MQRSANNKAGSVRSRADARLMDDDAVSAGADAIMADPLADSAATPSALAASAAPRQARPRGGHLGFTRQRRRQRIRSFTLAAVARVANSAVTLVPVLPDTRP